MRTVLSLCLLCAFNQAASALGEGSTRDGQSYLTELRRVSREVKPNPVDCRMSPWSEWSPCNNCTKTRYRSRSVESFGQFGGKPCFESLGDSQACHAAGPCNDDPQVQCSELEFKCDSGSCIKQRLKCNGDFDCEDQSDEDFCEKEERRPCGNLDVIQSELGRTAGYGINILGSDPRMNPFNNEFYNGQCSRVRDPSSLQYHRLPWNVGVLSYETRADETVSKEVYEDSSTLLKEMMDETTWSVDVGLSIKLTPSEKGSVSSNASADSGASITGEAGLNINFDNNKIIKQVAEYTNVKKKSFIRVKGSVQLSTYRMRSSNLAVCSAFLESVKSLPRDYQKGPYFRFLEDHGTHYTRNGRSGGEYELVYVLNQETIKEKHVTETTLKNCLKLGITAEFQSTGGIGGSGHIKPEYCKKLTDKITGEKESKPLIEKVITSVRGGTVDAAAAMKTKVKTEGVLDLDTYVNWARTIAILPALLHSEPEPIQNLIPLSMAHADTYRAHLQVATEGYVAEYSVCKCLPCQNGGTVSLLDGRCLCLCLPQFEGLACQDSKSQALSNKEAVVQEGNWGCWGSWSECSGGSRSRTRTCNTHGLTGGTCRGETINTEHC